MSTDITKAGQQALAVVPEHLRDKAAAQDANNMITQYASPMRLKIVQRMSRSPLDKEPYKEGDIVLAPNLDIVAHEGEALIFTPVFMFPEWITRNPTGSEFWIHSRSLDPRSEIARKSRDPKSRKETVDGKEVSHMEVYHFVVAIHETPTGAGDGMLAVMSFMSTALKTGSAFSTLIKQRGPDVAMYAGKYQAMSGSEANAKGSWKGLKIQNPSVGSPWVEDPALYEQLKAEHASQKKAYLAGAIQIDVEDEPADEEKTESDQY